MAKRVIIAGASGMIGSMLLDLCLKDDQIGEVISLVRKPSGVSHAKLKELTVTDFLNYDVFYNEFKGVDIVFYCVGVYTGAVPKDVFRKITVDYPVALGKAIHASSPGARFCLLSGQGADRSEKSRIMFARDKGAAENQLSKTGFASFHAFRPGYIYPVTKRKEPNFTYRLMRVLYPGVRLMGKKFSVKSTALAKAMFLTGMNGSELEIFENRDIVQLAGEF